MVSTKTNETGISPLHDSGAAVIESVWLTFERFLVLTHLSICFIHGLGGDREKTWQKGEIFWPRDLLRKDIPEARILTWGYTADVVQFWTPTSTNTVDDHARNLAGDLRGYRTGTKTLERPLIFVAHSLGGLVCARVWSFDECSLLAGLILRDRASF